MRFYLICFLSVTGGWAVIGWVRGTLGLLPVLAPRPALHPTQPALPRAHCRGHQKQFSSLSSFCTKDWWKNSSIPQSHIFVLIKNSWEHALMNNILVKGNCSGVFNLFLLSKTNGYFYLQRVSPPLKECHDMFSEGNAAHPVRCDSPLQIEIAVWHTFF